VSDAPALPWETHVDAKEITLAFKGELTIADAAAFHERLLQALTKGLDVRLDLENVAYLDAATLQLICAARRTAVATGVQLTLQHVQKPAIESARIFGMESVLTDSAIALER
jgi:anti-anti-sigma factor